MHKNLKEQCYSTHAQAQGLDILTLLQCFSDLPSSAKPHLGYLFLFP